MKGIFIDSVNREIKEVEIERGIDSIYKLLDCQLFDCVGLTQKEIMYVDDEGLMNGTEEFFVMKGCVQPYAGSALILGTTNEGRSKSTSMNLKEVKSKVYFTDRATFASVYNNVN